MPMKYLGRKVTLGKSILFAILSITSLFLGSMLLGNYYITKNNTYEVAESEAKEISSQILNNYENYIDAVIQDFSYLERLTGSLDNNVVLEDKIETVIDLKKNVTGCGIYDKSGKNLLGNVSLHLLDESYFKETLAHTTFHTFSKPYSNNGENFMMVGKVVTMLEHGSENDVVLFIETNFESVLELAKRSNLGDGGAIIFTDVDNSVVFSSSNTLCNSETCSFKDKINETILGTTIFKNKQHYALNVQTLTNTRWRVSIIINVNSFFSSMTLMNAILWTLSGIALVLAIIFSALASRRVSKPLKQLEEAMNVVESGDFQVKTNITEKGTQIEIYSVAMKFDRMVLKINELMESVVIEQGLQRKSELKALQNQINPHFLYNTLDSIAFLARDNKTKEVEEMVVALAKFFRISISKGKTVITVAEEMEHVRNYLLIQSIRFKDSFHFNLQIDPEVASLKTMKLILQPFVENSIAHGLKNLEGGDYIEVKAYKDSEHLIFEITDNGLGMRESKIQEIYDNMQKPELEKSVGIKNVYQRLKLFYGDSVSIKVESELDEYTKIIIITPLQTPKEDL